MDKTYPSDFGCLPGWGVAGNAQKFQTGYDNLASGGGGRIHLPERYYFTSPLHLHSNNVVITGNGPRTGFWFQLDDPTKDAFVVEPNNPSDPGSFLQGVEMRDFSVLGGASCAYNLVRIRYVVRSRFKGIHAMGGTSSHPFAIGTGWCNQFELVATFATDHDGLPSPIYRPSTWGQPLARPRSDYVHLLPSDEHRGGLNANHFWLLVEGYGYPQGQNPDTYNLVRISNQNGPRTVSGQSAGNWTDQGNNWITGTIEANVGGYGLYAEGCDSMCLHQLYLEECKGMVLANCRQPVVSQTRWYSKLVLDGCLLPVVTQGAGDALEITATTSHAGIGHLIVGQGTGTVVNNSPSTVTTGPVLQNATQTLLGGGIFTSIGTAPRFLDQTAIVSSAAYVSTGTTAPGDWKKTTP